MYLAQSTNWGHFPDRIGFRSVVYRGEGKTGVPNNKLNPQMTPSPGIEPGPHW